jgi:thioredoxin reductase (NADPH)
VHRELSYFPTGIFGQTLTARAFVQTQKFEAEMAIPVELTKLRREESAFILQSANGQRFRSSTVVVATGVRCRRLDAWSGSRIPAQFRG